MALQTFVKINHITNLTDARYCAGMMVDVLGFSLHSSDPNYVSPEQFKEITGWVSGVEFAAELGSASEAVILETIENYPGITWIEHERIEQLQELAGKGFSLLYKTSVQEIAHLEKEIADKLSEASISIHLFPEDVEITESEIESIKRLSQKCKVILGGGIDANNVLDRIEELSIFGISLNGGSEIKTGLRDFDQMAEILEILEIED